MTLHCCDSEVNEAKAEDGTETPNQILYSPVSWRQKAEDNLAGYDSTVRMNRNVHSLYYILVIISEMFGP